MLQCLNCQKKCTEHEGRIFMTIFVCSTCHLMAESLHNRIHTELKGLLVVLGDRIREALLQGKFFYNENSTPLETLSKKDLIGALTELQNMHQRTQEKQMQPPVTGQYTLECLDPECKKQKNVNHPMGAGWRVGDTIPFDPSEPGKSTCHICKRTGMRVVSVPAQTPSPPPNPIGFTKIPTK